MTVTTPSAPATATEPVPRLIGRAGSCVDGPALIVVGALHGNEPAGVLAAQRVLNRLERVAPERMLGRFSALVGNRRAYKDPDPHTRYLDLDLNRLFTPDEVDRARSATPADSVEHAEMRELLDAYEREARAVTGPVFMIDLHTASAETVPFCTIEDSIPARRFARAQPIPILLGFEEELPGLLIDCVTTRYRHVSLLIEAGQHDDPRSVDVHEAALWVALDASGVLPLGALEHERDPRRVIADATGRRSGLLYDVRHREPIRDPGFAIQPGLSMWDRLHRHRTTVATESGVPIKAAIDGLLFLPNMQRVKRIGDDGFFIVRRVSNLWLRLSAWLRSGGRLHRWLPRIAPGVRAHPDEPHQLVVAPEVAAVYKRELFHLLGYRLVRHGPDVHLSRPDRVWRGIGHLARALWTMAVGLLRGGERAALPEIRDEDWIAERRTLDRSSPSDRS